MTTSHIYVPRDASALSLGADSVARAIASEARARHADVRIIRNGSRGLFFLEAPGGVGHSQGRQAYGPVRPEDVPGLFDANFLQDGAKHALSLGATEEISWLKRQQRLTSARVGVIEPTNVADY